MASDKKPRKKSKEVKTPALERTYQDTMTYECPVRGWVTQVVTVKRYAAASAPVSQEDEDLKELLDTVSEEE